MLRPLGTQHRPVPTSSRALGRAAGCCPGRPAGPACPGSGPDGAPGTDLLTTSVLAAAAKKGWHEVDLTKFQLRTPEAGFYIAMEWLYTADRFGCEHLVTMQATKEKVMSYSYGQSLGGYLDATEPNTWYLSAGYSWQQFKPHGVLINRGNMNAAIQTVVQPD